MALTIYKINKTLAVCNRFIEAAIRAKKRAREIKSVIEVDDWMDQSKENGTVKRASLDLTRALAELRK